MNNPELLKLVDKAITSGKDLNTIRQQFVDAGFADNELGWLDDHYRKKKGNTASRSTSQTGPSSSESKKVSAPSGMQSVDPKQIASIRLKDSGDTPPSLISAREEQEKATAPAIESLKQKPEYNKRMSGSTAVQLINKINSVEDPERLSDPEIIQAFSSYRDFKTKAGEGDSIPSELTPETMTQVGSYLEKDAARFSDEEFRRFIQKESKASVGKGLENSARGFLSASYDFTKDLIGKNIFDFIGVEAFAKFDQETAPTASSLRLKAMEANRDYSLSSYAKKRKVGYTDEQIEKGSMSLALDGDFRMLGMDLLDQVPNLLMGAVPVVGAYAVAGGAAGSAYSQTLEDDSFSDQEKIVNALGIGLAEYFTEKLFMTDVASVRRMFGSKEIAKSSISDSMFSWIPKEIRSKYAVKIGEAMTENALEESIVSMVEQGLGMALAGKEFDAKQLAESAFIGAAMGSSISAAVNGPSAVLNSANMRTKIEIDNKIAKMDAMIADPSISESEREVLKSEVAKAVRERSKIKQSAAKFYEGFSEEDIQATVEANQEISKGLELYNSSSIAEVKAGAIEQVKNAVSKKKSIEDGYATQRKELPSKYIASIQDGKVKQSVDAMESRMQSAEEIDIQEIEGVAEQLMEAYQAAESDKSLRPSEKNSILDAIETKINELLDYELATTNRTEEATETSTVRSVIPTPREGVRQTVSKERFEGQEVDVDGKPAKIEKSGEFYDIVLQDGTRKPIDFNFIEFASSEPNADGTVSVKLTDTRDGSNISIKDNELSLDLAIAESQKQIGVVPEGTFQQVMRQVERKIESTQKVFVNEGKKKAAESLKGRRKKSIEVTSENASDVIDELSDQLDQMDADVFEQNGTTRSRAKAGLKSIRSVVDAISKTGKKTKVTVHSNENSYMDSVGETETTRGMHIKTNKDSSEIHIFLPAMIENTAYHEAMHEFLPDVFGKRAVNRLAARLITEARKDKALSAKFNEFLSQYDKDSQAEEFLVELAAMVASGDVEIKVKEGVISKFVRSMASLFGLNVEPNAFQMVEALDYMANSLAEGDGIQIDNLSQRLEFETRKKRQAPAGNKLFNEPLSEAKEIADSYFFETFGYQRPVFEGVKSVDKERAKKISDAYIAMKDEYSNPEVKEAYDAMINETLAQYEYMTNAGYYVEVNNEEPYASSQDMIKDLKENKRMKIFSTESGFGSDPITDSMRESNPLLNDSGFKDINGVTLLNNDIFRAVHDFFGHAELGNGFGAVGEENAWNVHARMYSDVARKAMTSETRGQNSFVNFSGVNDEAFKLRDEARKARKDGDIQRAEELVKKVYDMMDFAEQKVGILPEFAYQIDGVNDADQISEEISEALDGESETNSGTYVGVIDIPQKKAQRPAPSAKEDPRGFVRSLVQDVDISEFNGKKFVTNMYDQTNAGRTTFPSGISMDLKGGVGYAAYMMSIQGKKIGDVSNLSAYNSKSNADSFIRTVRESGASLFVPLAGTVDGSWKFQGTIFEQMFMAVSESMPKNRFEKMINSILKSDFSKGNRNMVSAISRFEKNTGIKLKNFSEFSGNYMAFADLLNPTKENASPDLRVLMVEAMIRNSDVLKAFGVKNMAEFSRTLVDPLNLGANSGDMLSFVEFDPSTMEVRQTKTNDIDHHPSFGWTVLAKINGIYQPTEFHKTKDSSLYVEKFPSKGSPIRLDKGTVEFDKAFGSHENFRAKAAMTAVKKAQVVSPDNSANYANLTEDGKGSFVFYHFSDTNFDAPDPNMAGKNRRNITSKEEKAALSTAGPVTMFYTDINDREGLVSSEFGYEVRVPMDRVYDLDSDPMNLEEEARERFKAENPNLAFGASHRAFAMTALAVEKGFDMTVGRWVRGLSRAHAAIKLPVTDRMISRGKNKKQFNETFESNKEKGWQGVSPSDFMGDVIDSYTKISWERGDQKRYDDIYRLYYEYGNYSQEQITEMINSSDLSAESKKLYNDALAAVPDGYKSVKKAQKKAQGRPIDVQTVELAKLATRRETTVGGPLSKTKKVEYFLPMTEDDYVYDMIGILPESEARKIYKKVKSGSAFVDSAQAAKDSLSELQKNLKKENMSLLTKVIMNLTDSQKELKNLLKEAEANDVFSLLVTRAGHGSIAKFFYDQYEKDVYEGLSKDEIETLDKIIFTRRVIQIDTNADAQGKERPRHPAGPNGEMLFKESAELTLLTIQNEVGPEVYDKLLNRSERYFGAFRTMLYRAYENGLITKESYDMFANFDYQPRRFYEHVVDFGDDIPNDFKVGNAKNMLKAIKNGSFDPAVMDSRYLLAAYTKSLESRIANNTLRREMSILAADPKNADWIRVTEKSGSIPADLQPKPKGFEVVTFFENGKQDAFLLREDLIPQLNDAGKIKEFINSSGGNWIANLSMSRVLKGLATATNPLFVVTNVPRDFLHVLLFTDRYDGMDLFSASVKLAMDAVKGGYAKWAKNDLYRDWIMHGGGMDFLSTQGSSSVAAVTGKKISEKLSYLGELSEAAFRMAVYKRSLDIMAKKNNGVVTEEMKVMAAMEARQVIDFAQGGRYVKGAELVMPYINAAFQGARVSANYIANNPAMFAAKLGQAFVGIAGLALYNASFGEDEMEKIPEYVKKNYFVIMTGKRDKDGNMKYLKIAKTQQARMFLTPLENIAYGIAGEMTGKEINAYHQNVDSFGDYIMQFPETFSPIEFTNPEGVLSSIAPVINMGYTYVSNYDSFRKQVVSREAGKVLPKYEGIEDKDIPVFYKILGQMTNMSPARMKAAAEKVITSPSSTITVGIAYAALDLAARAVDYTAEGDVVDLKLNELSNPVALGLALNVEKKFLGTADQKYVATNLKKEFEKIDQQSGSERKEIDLFAKSIGRKLQEAEFSKESLESAKKEWTEFQKKLVGSNPTDIQYANRRLTAIISKQNYPPVYDDIRFSANDKARAEKIMLYAGKMSMDELKEFYVRVAKESGYALPSGTIHEYKKLSGIK